MDEQQPTRIAAEDYLETLAAHGALSAGLLCGSGAAAGSLEKDHGVTLGYGSAVARRTQHRSSVTQRKRERAKETSAFPDSR